MDVMEQGQIYFLYRPRVETGAPATLEDVQRFYVVLHPRGQSKYRFIIVGRKKMPDPSLPGREKYWGFVECVVSNPKEFDRARLQEQHYWTATRGQRWQPAARPVGEGAYALVDHDGHAHLAYVLQLPIRPGPVQDAMNIREEASYVISVKNPELPLPITAEVNSPEQDNPTTIVEKKVAGNRFVPAQPALLDYDGAEILLISAAEDVHEELGLDLNTERESARSARIFNDLRLETASHPVEPLFEGEWA